MKISDFPHIILSLNKTIAFFTIALNKTMLTRKLIEKGIYLNKFSLSFKLWRLSKYCRNLAFG